MTVASYEIQDLDEERRRALIDSAQMYKASVARARRNGLDVSRCSATMR
jgi:uncharacterized protein (DUF2461 family)